MVWRWFKAAANNGTADPICPWPEGMPPSQINDSARAMEARVKQWHDDIAGAIATTGSSSAYAVSSNQVYDTLAHLDGGMIGFTPHTGNASPVTLNVDGLGAKPLRLAPGVEVPAATLVQGTPYIALFNTVDGAFYLRGFLNLPYSVPIGGLMPFISASVPNSNFVQPYGQALSRTIYSVLFSLIGTTYGSGDGSTTFNIPDLRGRVPVGADAMGGAAAGRVTAAGAGFDGTVLGATGGAQSKVLAIIEMPQHSHTLVDPGHTHAVTIPTGNAGGGGISQFSGTFVQFAGAINSGISTTGITLATSGSSSAFSFLQPSIVLPYVLRAI